MTRARDLADYISTGVSDTELDVLDGVTAGTVTASKALVVDANKDVASLRNVSFDDNGKAIFGAGSDLQIYHDGSNSYIDDAGTGNLNIRASANVAIDKYTGEAMARFYQDAGVFLYYNNSTKFQTDQYGITVTGRVATDALTVDDITIDGSTISDAGDLTLDSGGNVILDSDGAHVFLRDGGTEYARLTQVSSGLRIQTVGQDADIVFRGNDNGGDVDALTLDMSDAGSAIFNHDVKVPDNGFFVAGAGSDLRLSSDGTNGTIDTPNGDLTIDVAGDIIFDADGGDVFFKDGGTSIGLLKNNNSDFEMRSLVNDKDIKFSGEDGGSTIVALTIDMSEAGAATFNDSVSIGDPVGGTVGVLTGTSGNDFKVAGTVSNIGGIQFGNSKMMPVKSNSLANDAVDLGSASYMWKDAYINRDIFVGSEILHVGDNDTKIGFLTNEITFTAGGQQEMKITTGGVFLDDAALNEDYDALSGTTPTISTSAGGMFSLTMSGNTTFTFQGATSGYAVGFILQLTGNGGTVTYPNTVDWAGGSAPDAPANGETDILVFVTRDGGSNWYGALAVDAAA